MSGGTKSEQRRKSRKKRNAPSRTSKYERNYSWAENLKTKIPVFMKITADKYQLPLAVADSAAELARILGVQDSTISKGLKCGRSYIVVWINKDELDEQEEIL